MRLEMAGADKTSCSEFLMNGGLSLFGYYIYTNRGVGAK